MLHELALFAGGGGGILASHLLGIRTIGAVEINPAARAILHARQRDGYLPFFPVWDDIRTFNGKPWADCVDLISGGFPCQDISAAGSGAGLSGTKSGLWHEMYRIICEILPPFVFLENSPLIIRRGLPRILGQLAAIGYNAEWCMLGAANVGAPHIRKRFWLLAAHAHRTRCAQTPQKRPDSQAGRAEPCGIGHVPDPYMSGRKEQRQPEPATPQDPATECRNWWTTEPGICRMAHGVANRVDRLQALGNGQVPAVAATAFCALYTRLFPPLSKHGTLVPTP